MAKEFKWERAVALEADGKTIAEIAAELGNSEGSAYQLIRYAKQRDKNERPLPPLEGGKRFVAEIALRPSKEKDVLWRQAKARGISLAVLVDHMLCNIVESDLFAAVLDD